MVERSPGVGAMTDAQLLARVWDLADQAVEPVDVDSIARGATRVPIFSSMGLRISARGILAPAAWWPAYGFVLLFILLASLAAAALFVGSQQRDVPEQRLPPPFGPARNGVIVFSRGINTGFSPLVQFDPATGSTVTLRSEGWLVEPLFSPDGRQILFWEQAGSWGPSSLWVMNADGSRSRQLLPVGNYSQHPAWAPDGDRILVADQNWLYVVDVASGSFVRHSHGIDIGAMTPSSGPPAVSWRPSHEQVLLMPDAPDSYLINTDGTGLRWLRGITGAGRSATWSPDGSTIAYSTTGRVHLLDVDSGIDRDLTFDGSHGTDEVVEFSPDGARLLIFRRTGVWPTSCGIAPGRACEYEHPIIVPVTGGGPEVVLGSFDVMAQGFGAAFTPDGNQVLGISGADPKGVWLYDADTGEAAAMTGPPWESEWWGMTWQRLAPCAC